MKIFSVFILLMISSICHAISIEGKWKSSGELTNRYNNENAKLTEEQKEFFSQLMGHMTVEFENGISIMNMPTITITTNNEKSQFEGFKDTSNYKVVASDKNTIVLETEDHDDSKLIATYHFVDSDTMWLYVASQSFMFPEINIREYFVRCK